MESNERYYRRRATQEIAAARRAVTHSALERRRSLAELYLRRLSELTGSDELRMLQDLCPPALRDESWLRQMEEADTGRRLVFA